MPPKVEIYEPPKKKEIIFVGHKYKKDSQFIPEFLIRVFQWTFDRKFDSIDTEIMTLEEIKRILNLHLKYKGKHLELSEKNTKSFPALIITFEKAKITFGDEYLLLPVGSCFIAGKNMKEFVVDGKNYLILR